MKEETIKEKILLLSGVLLYRAKRQISDMTMKYISVPLKLNRDYKRYTDSNRVKVHVNPQVVENINNSFDKSKILSINYFSNAILNFLDVLEREFPKFLLRNFYDNIEHISINKVQKIIKNKKINGRYRFYDNIIDLDDNSVSSIYHELFHLASTRVSGKYCYSGFLVYDKHHRQSIGRGINEGYTQLLTERYFGGEKTKHFLWDNYGMKATKRIVGGSYSFQVFICSMLEEIVGKTNMEKMYLTANLYDLVNILSKFSNKNSTEEFLSNMDFLHENLKYVYLLSYDGNVDKIKTVFIKTCKFLIDCYKMKLNIEVKNGLSNSKKDLMLKKFINSLSNCYDKYFEVYDYNKSNLKRKK